MFLSYYQLMKHYGNVGLTLLKPLNANPTEWAKHTQTIRRQFANELFECVSSFCGVGT